MSTAVRFVVGWAAVLWVSAASAQAPESASTLYGRGVDAYFSGNSTQAEQYLDQAIAGLPDDPRPYYFRALALLRVGRSDEARSDMEIGAAIEARRPKQFAVGTALERVQGSDRLLLEQYRRNGHAAGAIERDRQIRGRYTPPAESDSRLLREPDAYRHPALQSSSPTKSSSDDNPFADERPKTPQPAVVPSDPFATDSGHTATDQGRGSSAAGAKMPPGKLLGVFGHVLEKTVPLPSMEDLKNQLPGTAPSPNGKSGTNKPKPETKPNSKPNPSNNSEDPFGGS